MIPFQHFAQQYKKYPSQLYSIHYIATDVVSWPSILSIELFDGESFGASTYLIKATTNDGELNQIFVPLAVHEVLDLEWLDGFIRTCAADEQEVILGIYSKETIIYQFAQLGMPQVDNVEA